MGAESKGTKATNTNKEASAKNAAVWAPWVEPSFPFFSSVLDARVSGTASPLNNLTPRGLILNLGRGKWACFDTDLLRISAIWSGKSVTPEGLGPLSYADRSKKTDEGQRKLPIPEGLVWLANGIYPGWQAGETLQLVDPREPGPVIQEVGRGPLPSKLGRFESVSHTSEGLCLEYTVAGTQIKEWISTQEGADMVRRRFVVAPSKSPLTVILGRKHEEGEPLKAVTVAIIGGEKTASLLSEESRVWAVRIAPHTNSFEFNILISPGDLKAEVLERIKLKKTEEPSKPRWPEIIRTQTMRSQKTGPYVIDDIPLPLSNPWKRNVRPVDLKFFRDGTAACVTFDGDVWKISGLNEPAGEVSWKRFASGLHEPMSLVIRNEEIFVYDRHGIWQLRDNSGTGEADECRMFANNFAQTAETRDFASAMKLAPDGSFIISKGGQQGTTLGKHNGMVLRVAPDGQTTSVLGWGFRGPFLGVHPETGAVTVSDQEGNYVPTTPLHLLSDKNEYHGFLSALLAPEKYPAPIADPLVWIPHTVNASALTQTWLVGAKMGPLNGQLLHFGYNRPEVFEVLLNKRSSKPQAAVLSLTRELEFPPMNGSVNPVDGQLYVTGFVGWGTNAVRDGGMARIRYTDAPFTLPTELVPMDQGVLLRFNIPMDAAKAAVLANYSVERWNYQRTFKYGSPHLKLDGSPGQDRMPLGSVYLSKDQKAVFIGIPDMKPVMQMRVGWDLESAAKVPMRQDAFFTPYELQKFDPVAEGFGEIQVNLEAKQVAEKTEMASSAEDGSTLFNTFGCVACHSTDGSMVGKLGPTWKGLFGSKRHFSDGTQATADETYIRQSIMDPGAKIVSGYENSESGMPNYSGVLSPAQIESMVLFIKSLQ